MNSARGPSDGYIYRRVLTEARPFWGHIAALLILSLVDIPLTLLGPLPLKIIVDSVLGAHPLPAWLAWLLPADIPRSGTLLLATVVALLIIIAFAKQLFETSFAVFRSFTGEKLVLTFRARLFRHTQGLSLAYHDRTGTADSAYRILYDAPAIQWITVDAFIPLLSSLLTLAAMIVVVMRIDWQLGLVAMTVVPLLYFVSQIYSRRLKVHWRTAKHLESSTLAVIQEVLTSVRVVKAFSQEDREHARYVEHAGRSLRQQIRLALTSGTFSLIVGVAMAAGTALVLFLAARHVQSGRITLGELVLVMAYLALLYAPLQALSKSAASLQGSLVSAGRAFELLDHAPEVPEKAHPKSVTRARGQVAFRQVSFAYSPDHMALCDISFDVPAGARVGIAGTTGAGKSTLVSLLLRFYDPTHGSILLDGVDLRDLRLRDLRNQFAIVLQEPVLFSSTIGENIAYACPEASDSQIIAAARAANAHDFISRLPRAYDTEVGERGVQLSGGERQRISLARAFLRDAPILILDEPTSSVDVKTESAIVEAMDRLMHGRTTFMIAHRLSTLEICDVRLQLEHGRLVQFTTGLERGVQAAP